MTPKEAKLLQSGNRVRWQQDNSLGTVREIAPFLRIDWDNGQKSAFDFANVPELVNLRDAQHFVLA